MKIKNISNKPISFGAFGVLPDEISPELPGGYGENHPIVKMYVKRGFIRIVGGNEILPDDNDDNGGNGIDGGGRESGEPNSVITESIYSGMSVNNLRKECKERGIKYTSKTNKDALIALLLEHDENNIDGDGGESTGNANGNPPGGAGAEE